MNEPKKHHIVPKTYLGLFTNARDKLYRININNVPRQKNGIYKTAPLKEWTVSQVCYKENFYRIQDRNLFITDTIEDENYVEKYCFLWYENHLEKIIKQIRKRQKYLSLTDARILAGGLFHIKFRNNYRRRRFPKKEIIESVHESLLKNIEKYPTEWKNLLEKYENTTVEKAIESAKKMEQDWLNNPNFVDELENRSLMKKSMGGDEILDNVSELCMKSQWNILETTITNLFITSDNPGFCINENNQIDNINFGGEFKFFFPLTPYYCLMIDKQERENFTSLKPIYFIQIDAELVDKINNATCSFVNDEIYSNSEKSITESWINYYERKSSVTNN